MVQLHQYQNEFEQKAVSIAAISVDSPDEVAATREKTGVGFSFLSDEKGLLLDAFGLRHVGGNAIDGSDISRPAILLLDKNGNLLFSEVTTNYRVRPTAEEIVKHLDDLP